MLTLPPIPPPRRAPGVIGTYCGDCHGCGSIVGTYCGGTSDGTGWRVHLPRRCWSCGGAGWIAWRTHRVDVSARLR